MKDDNYNSLDLNLIKEQMDRFGHSIISMNASDYLPSFAYTVGLLESKNHPEIICFGLAPELLKDILNDVVQLIKFSGALKLDHDYGNIFKNSRASFLKVDQRNITDYFKVAELVYKSDDIQAIQLIWTDTQNLFPWEVGFNQKFKFKQPLLDRNESFKFREERNLGVFTTPNWLENRAPILRVIHDEDGDWQFLTREIDFDNGKMVSLGQMVRSDHSLNEVFHLEYGESAERAHPGGEWKITRITEE